MLDAKNQIIPMNYSQIPHSLAYVIDKLILLHMRVFSENPNKFVLWMNM
jgi:hypothetical protein